MDGSQTGRLRESERFFYFKDKTERKAQLKEQLNSIRAASGRSQKTPDKPKTPAEKKADLLKKFSISDDLLLKQQETDASEPAFGQSESGNA